MKAFKMLEAPCKMGLMGLILMEVAIFLCGTLFSPLGLTNGLYLKEILY